MSKSASQIAHGILYVLGMSRAEGNNRSSVVMEKLRSSDFDQKSVVQMLLQYSGYAVEGFDADGHIGDKTQKSLENLWAAVQ